MKRFLNWLVVIVFAAISVLLFTQNQTEVEFSFPYLSTTSSLGFLLLATLFVGILLGALFMSLSLLRSKMDVSKTKKQLVKIEEEVENLRSAPIKNDL